MKVRRLDKPLDTIVIGQSTDGTLIVRDSFTGNVSNGMTREVLGRPLTALEKHCCGEYGDETD